MKKKILFICLGNICRSPAAEEVFRSIVRQHGDDHLFEIDSAGLIDFHEGELADPRMRQCASRRGYRLTHRSRPVTSDDFRHFDYLIAMDADNIKRLKHKSPQPELHKKIVPLATFLTRHEDTYIPDPYYGNEKDFAYVIDLLEDACSHLYDSLTGNMRE